MAAINPTIDPVAAKYSWQAVLRSPAGAAIDMNEK